LAKNIFAKLVLSQRKTVSQGCSHGGIQEGAQPFSPREWRLPWQGPNRIGLWPLLGLSNNDRTIIIGSKELIGTLPDKTGESGVSYLPYIIVS